MNIQTNEASESKNQSAVHTNPLVQLISEFQPDFTDHRAETVLFKKVNSILNNSPQVKQLKHFQKIANNGSSSKNFTPQTTQLKEQTNSNGLPETLKNGIENLSGLSMNDVNVHYNSDKPAQLQALAYAQGNEIHIGPGQEKHLPHEAWHVVQQKQGKVRPTVQLASDIMINDDKGLEQEADVMGNKALSGMEAVTQAKSHESYSSSTIQRMVGINSDDIHAEITSLIKDPTKIGKLTEAYTLLQHLDWAHNIVGGKVFDFTAPAYNAIGKTENLILVAHGSPGSSGGFSGDELGLKLADVSTGLPQDWAGEIFVTSCYSGTGVNSVIAGIADELQKQGRNGIKVTGYAGTTFTHKQFNEFLFVLKPGMEQKMKIINDQLALTYQKEFTTWWLKMQGLKPDNILEMADYTSQLTAQPYQELIDMAVKGNVEFLSEQDGEVSKTS